MTTDTRRNSIDIDQEDFRKIGHELVDRIADLLSSMGDRPVTTKNTPKELGDLLGRHPLPENEHSADQLLATATELLFENSLFNGHPKFFGFITSSAAPIGVLADLLAAAVNPNVGGQILSPIATEIEKQTIGWLCDFIGVPTSYGGILVSGGNMANFTAFLAARTAMAPKSLKEQGLQGIEKKLIVYCSKSTHTWIDKAAILFGHGSDSVRWIATDKSGIMDNDALKRTIVSDLEHGHQPFLVVGTAGDVSTGIVDDLKAIASICKENKLWFHIDGAYGIPAAVLPEMKRLFEGVLDADSIAMDPHKWLYSPLEAGCTLVKNPQHLIDTYSSHPEYYNFSLSEEGGSQNYFEFGLQNSRGFRALKVWLALQQVGRNGYAKLIGEDVELAQLFFELADKHPELEAKTNNLSITTLRYVPKDISPTEEENTGYLDRLNEAVLNNLQQGGRIFLSNAIVNQRYHLRACIVNFRTTKKDIEESIEIIVQTGRATHNTLQEKANTEA